MLHQMDEPRGAFIRWTPTTTYSSRWHENSSRKVVSVTLFTKKLYSRLSNTFGHIAHYNQGASGRSGSSKPPIRFVSSPENLPSIMSATSIFLPISRKQVPLRRPVVDQELRPSRKPLADAPQKAAKGAGT